MRICAIAIVSVLLVAATPTVFALTPGDHLAITHETCVERNLPPGVCVRIANAAVGVDGDEWEDLAAHAQRQPWQPACEAADAAAQRVYDLAANGRQSHNAGAIADAAEALGRALHTVQDECAHQGMTNPQHADASLRAHCGDDHEDIDEAPEALACARQRTKAVLSAFAQAVRNPYWDAACDGIGLPCTAPTVASLGDGCRFIHSHVDWDGVDTRWQPVVGERLMAALMDGLANRNRTPVCAFDDVELAQPQQLQTDVAQTCTSIDIFCGKSDDGQLGGASDDNDAAAGCRASGGTSPRSGLPLGLVVGAALLGLGRRRGHRRGRDELGR